MNNKIIKKLKQMTKKSFDNDDVPIACIITLNDKIISSAYNNKYKNNNPIGHAEINAIVKACKKLDRLNLSDCVLYTTLYPCKMCEALIDEVRIKKVIYILDKEKTINNTIIYKQMFKEEKDYFNREIKEFFLNKR